MTTPEHLNDALLWLAEHKGKITFGANVNDRLKGLGMPQETVVNIEAMPFTEEESKNKAEVEPLYGVAQVDRGNVVGAILAAIQAARELSYPSNNDGTGT